MEQDASRIQPTDNFTRPIAQILEPLLTCQKFFSEALPVFYRTNAFNFLGFGELFVFLDKMPVVRRQYVVNLSAAYKKTDSEYGMKTFRLLGEMTNLHHLNLSIDEESWLRRLTCEWPRVPYAQTSKEKKDAAIWDLPGLQRLRELPNLQDVNFLGRCKRIKALVKRELESRQDTAGKASCVAKRKADKTSTKNRRRGGPKQGPHEFQGST